MAPSGPPYPTSAPALLAARFTVVCCAVAAALGAAAGALPLLEVPGLELGLAAAICSALALGPASGVAAARRALRAAGSPPVVRAYAAAALGAAAPVAALLAGSAARAAVATPCRPLASAALFCAVAGPSALLAAAVGLLAGVAARGRRGRAALLYAAVAAASLGATVAVVYRGPGASARDHLFGVWPGPLYDEALALDRGLVLFRAATLAWAAAAVAAASLLARRRQGRRAAPAAAALVVAIAAALALRAAGGRDPTRADIAAALGASRDGPRCTIHFAREKSAAEADRLIDDCEYDAAAVAAALGLAAPPRATVWIYRSPAEKRRLVGAGHTSFTKPWLAEVHVHEEGVPHPILRHELVHALASAAGRGLLRVPARAGLLVDLGLVEGLAVAYEAPRPGEGLHAWTRALRDEGRLPPVSRLFQAGFLGAAPARAYTAAGSFVRFLAERHGTAPLLHAYGDDDLARAFGQPLDALGAEWSRFLDGLRVPPALAAAAEARFARGSLFDRQCAREVADDEARAAEASAAGRAGEAEGLYRRAAALSGGDPAVLRGVGDAWRAAGDLPRAGAAYAEALVAAERAGSGSALRTALLGALGDVALRAGEAARAAERYREALALGPEGAEARTLHAKLAAARDPALALDVTPWLLGAAEPAAALARLGESRAPLARYLLARAELARGEPARALDELAALDPRALPDAAFAVEARRMRADALCRAHRFGDGIAAWRAIARDADAEGTRAWAEDNAERCAFVRDRSAAGASAAPRHGAR